MPARSKADVFDKVRKAAAPLPDVTEGISWGVPALNTAQARLGDVNVAKS
jgi:hypothetical protein